MSEKKLYAVKNDEGKFWEFFDNSGFWSLDISDSPITPSKYQAEQVANEHGGHVVTFIEEPEKVVLNEEQAEIVDKARDEEYPATYISGRTDVSNGVEKLLINAYVNGYTVAKEKKYYVKVPLVQAQGGLWFYINSDDKLDAIFIQRLAKKFTMDEIKENGLQDCEKEEANEDDD